MIKPAHFAQGAGAKRGIGAQKAGIERRARSVQRAFVEIVADMMRIAETIAQSLAHLPVRAGVIDGKAADRADVRIVIARDQPPQPLRMRHRVIVDKGDDVACRRRNATLRDTDRLA